MFRFLLCTTLFFVMTPALADDFPATDYSPDVVFVDPVEPTEGTPQVVIKTKDVVNVGDMIIIDLSESTGGGFDLQIRPEPPVVRVFNEGRIITAATGDEPIEYLFIFSCACGDKSDVQTKVIRVEAKQDPIVDPDDDPTPDEDPVVEPDEDPTPEPEGLVGKVVKWCNEVESPDLKSDALKLQQVFTTLALSIESGAFSDVPQMMDATKEANDRALGANKVYWTAFLDHLSDELGTLFDDGQLPTIESHAKVWAKVAQGLQVFSQGVN